MPVCRECGESFPNKIKIDGKWRNIRNRARCINCQPFGEIIEKEVIYKNCLQCGKLFKPKENVQKFCSHSCSASFNNIRINRHNEVIACKQNIKNKIINNIQVEKKCIYCGNKLSKTAKKYCSVKCMQNHLFEYSFEKFLMCGELPDKFTNRFIKRILIELYGNVCHECGITDWNGKDIVLDIEHIDGNSENNSFLNLSILCPNCHSQTPTWRGRGKKGHKKDNIIPDSDFISALKNSKNISQALSSLGLSPKGGNYSRAKKLMETL